jgi:hypothetical protein
MATGPEHYKAAEDGITASTWQRQEWGEDAGPQRQEDALKAADWELRVAQVHATLALAAAVALFLPLDAANERRPEDEDAWHKVAGTYVNIDGQERAWREAGRG